MTLEHDHSPQEVVISWYWARGGVCVFVKAGMPLPKRGQGIQETRSVVAADQTRDPKLASIVKQDA